VQSQTESRDVQRVTIVLWVPELRSVLPVSTIEEKGYAVLFLDRKVVFMPRGSSSKSAVVLGVRKSNIYREKDHPMRVMANSSRVTVNREQVLQDQMGERNLPRLFGRCHESRKLRRKLRSGRLLGPARLPKRNHAIQQDLLR
jgi:hypothetical protein